ncbi:hypothetical protein MRX96_006127 [Rhipicephalus microplus]
MTRTKIVTIGVVLPVERNWLFAPWVCDTMDYVRRKFSVISTAPLGKDERTMEVSVWPYAWADTAANLAVLSGNPGQPERIRLFTHCVSGGFYAETFLNRLTFFYARNTAPSSVVGGEPGLELTRPGPSIGFWQEVWSEKKGVDTQDGGQPQSARVDREVAWIREGSSTACHLSFATMVAHLRQGNGGGSETAEGR